MKTITVGELIAHLEKFDKSLPVAYTWEGQMICVNTDGVFFETHHKYGDLIFLDAESGDLYRKTEISEG